MTQLVGMKVPSTGAGIEYGGRSGRESPADSLRFPGALNRLEVEEKYPSPSQYFLSLCYHEWRNAMRFVNALSSFANRRHKGISAQPTPSTHKRFLHSGNWAEQDSAGHNAAMNAYGVEAARRFSIPR